jgi:hypothetical protein
MEQVPIEGRKIFFLYPHSVIQDELIDALVMYGFEIYILRDHKRAHSLIERFPGSIMFVNIDERLEEKDWEVYIREIQDNPNINVRLGILSYNNDRVLMEKYLMDIMIPCGYIQLKLGVKESTQIIYSALLVNEAKGRRKCFRAICEGGTAALNYRGEFGVITGSILDISSAGIAARIKMSSAYTIDKNATLQGVQLKLRGSLAMANLIYMGPRFDSQDIWILLFDPKNMADNSTLTIHRFIKLCLQHFIDTLKV